MLHSFTFYLKITTGNLFTLLGSLVISVTLRNSDPDLEEIVPDPQDETTIRLKSKQKETLKVSDDEPTCDS